MQIPRERKPGNQDNKIAAEPTAIYLNTSPIVNVNNCSGWTAMRTRFML